MSPRRVQSLIASTKRLTGFTVGCIASDASQLSSAAVEPMVEQQLHDLLGNKPQLSRWLDDHPQAKPVAEILASAAALSERYRTLDDHIKMQQILRRVFRSIIVKPNAIVFEIVPSALLAMLILVGT